MEDFLNAICSCAGAALFVGGFVGFLLTWNPIYLLLPAILIPK